LICLYRCTLSESAGWYHRRKEFFTTFRRLGRVLVILLASAACWGQPVVQAVLNGASYSGNVAPGTWVSIFGTELATSVATGNRVPLQTTLNDVSVSIGGIAAPLSYVSPTQINAVVPFEITVSPASAVSDVVRVPVVVTAPAGTSPPLTISLSRESPGLFTQNGGGTGTVIALDANFNLLSAVGSGPIVLYADGLGPTNPPASSASGGASSEPLNRVVDNVSVFVGDTQATVTFAGLAPGFPGIYQLNVIPNGPISDRVYLQVNGWQSNITSLPISPGSNATNVTGSIQSLYPPTTGPVTSSAMLIAGTFGVDLDILPGAQPFSIVAAGDGGNALIEINPAVGTWQATLIEPTVASRDGNFFPNRSGFNVVWNFLTCESDGLCSPFPNNAIPVSLMDPLAVEVMNQLPSATPCGESAAALPGIAMCPSANGTYSATGSLPAGGHFSISASTLSNLTSFGGFIQIAEPGPETRTATFDLYVDGKLIASDDVTYQVHQP
jgi:uncharacterized protein (TIGR03437 family)